MKKCHCGSWANDGGKVMKATKIGWVGKSVDLNKIILCPGDYMSRMDLDLIYYARGKRYSWMDQDWPPRKVRVIVEEV